MLLLSYTLARKSNYMLAATRYNAERDWGHQICIQTDNRRTRTRTCAYEPFHAFPYHARKFMSPKQVGGGRRETESTRLHFPLAVAPSFLRVLVARCGAGWLALVLIINARGFFSLPFSLSPLRLIYYSLTRHFAVDSICTKPLRRERITRLRWSAHTVSLVDRIAKVPITSSSMLSGVITKYSDWCRYAYPSWIDFADKIDG